MNSFITSQVNLLRPEQNGCHFPDDIFKCIFLNEDVWISLKISQKFVPEIRINNIPALVQIMARRQPGDKPLPEPMMVDLLMHIYVTRPQWVNTCGAETGIFSTDKFSTIKLRHYMYHGSWCPGFLHRQGINRYGIDHMGEQVLIFHRDGFQLPLPSQCWEIIKHVNIFYVSCNWFISRLMSTFLTVNNVGMGYSHPEFYGELDDETVRKLITMNCSSLAHVSLTACWYVHFLFCQWYQVT